MMMMTYRQYPSASSLDHRWVSGDWLTSLGLGQYAAVFTSQLVDARLLNTLSKKDLDKHLSVHNKFHQSSILHGVQLLRTIRFDVQVIMIIFDSPMTINNIKKQHIKKTKPSSK